MDVFTDMTKHRMEHTEERQITISTGPFTESAEFCESIEHTWVTRDWIDAWNLAYK